MSVDSRKATIKHPFNVKWMPLLAALRGKSVDKLVDDYMRYYVQSEVDELHKEGKFLPGWEREWITSPELMRLLVVKIRGYVERVMKPFAKPTKLPLGERDMVINCFRRADVQAMLDKTGRFATMTEAHKDWLNSRGKSSAA